MTLRYLPLLLLSACAEYGPELSEPGQVIQTCYVPPGHGTSIGFTSNGSTSTGSVSIPARYAVVFSCAHGQFAVNSYDAWRSVKQGDAVTIFYREELDDGVVVDLDFLRAEKSP